jgi:HPt (histidine-containing phosphotransfer) domain-containing protein
MSTSTSFPTELRLPAPRPRAIDVAAALEQVGGDYEFVMAVMRDEFLAKAPDQIARCVANARLADARVADAAAKDKRDAALKALAFEAHSMKGASATLHADALSKACHRLERVAKGVPLDALEPDSGAHEAPRTFEQRTREMADRFAELEADVADLAAITDVDVAAASEALGSRLCVTLARLAGDAAALAASPAALEAAASRAGGAGRNRSRQKREPLASLARTVAADAKAVGARALRNAVRRMDALVFSCDETLDHALEKTCGEDKRGQIFEDVVAAYVELRRAAQTVAFDCAAVCSREETAGFARRTREALGGAADSFKKPPPALARTSLVDASTARGDLFDAAATAADTRRFFHSPPTSADGEEATSTSGIETSKPKPRNLGDLGHLDAGADAGAPPVDFPRAVRALDGDVAFAEKMLRTFLADAESFTSKPLGSPSPLAGDSERLSGFESQGDFGEKPERAGTRLSEERRRDAERLGETADWLGAPPLRAAIATLLDGDAGEHAVRAARRAVRDLRAFADGLESNIAGGGFGGNDLNDARDARPGGSPLPSLPKKSASTDQVMRSGLYAYSSSSVGTSGGASADSNEDSDGKSHRGSFGSDRDRDGRRSSTDSERFGSRLAASRGGWGGSSGRVSADSAGAAEGAVTALAALSPRARARGLAAIRAPRRRHGALVFDLRRALERAGGDWDFAVACAEKHASAAREQIAVLRAVLFVDASLLLLLRRRSRSTIAPTRRLSPPASRSSAPSRRARRFRTRRGSWTPSRRSPTRSSRRRRASSSRLRGRRPPRRATARTIDPRRIDDSNARVHGSSRESAWRARSRKLLRALERRADEYVKEIDATAHVSRAFSPRFVFSDLCGGDASVAVEKLRVLTRAARDAHVAAVRAVAAAEASFGAAALGGTFREEHSEGERAGFKEGFFEENRSSSDEGDAKTKTRSKAKAFSFEENGRFGEISRKRAPAHDRKHASPHDPYAILDDVRYGLSGAFGSLEACERLASSLGARPSERAFRGAAARVARIAVEVSAAAAGAPGGHGTKTSVPACFLDDEHAQTVAALAALKREVEALVADFHVIAPEAATHGEGPAKPGRKNVGGGFSSSWSGFSAASTSGTTCRSRTRPASIGAPSPRARRAWRTSACGVCASRSPPRTPSSAPPPRSSRRTLRRGCGAPSRAAPTTRATRRFVSERDIR